MENIHLIDRKLRYKADNTNDDHANGSKQYCVNQPCVNTTRNYRNRIRADITAQSYIISNIKNIISMYHTVSEKIRFPLLQFHHVRQPLLRAFPSRKIVRPNYQINFQVHTWAASLINIHHLRRDVTLDILYKLVHNP